MKKYLPPYQGIQVEVVIYSTEGISIVRNKVRKKQLALTERRRRKNTSDREDRTEILLLTYSNIVQHCIPSPSSTYTSNSHRTGEKKENVSESCINAKKGGHWNNCRGNHIITAALSKVRTRLMQESEWLKLQKSKGASGFTLFSIAISIQ